MALTRVNSKLLGGTFSSDSSGNLNIDSGTFYVDATNNRVGVGTTSPNSKISIGGSGANRISFSAGTGTNFVGYDGVNDALQLATLTYLAFQAGSGYPERMRITADGNVGIGTNSPGSKLDVSSTTDTLTRVISGATSLAFTRYTNGTQVTTVGQENSTGGSLAVGSTAYSSVFGTNALYPLHLVTNNTVRATIDSSGRVGVNTGSTSLNANFSVFNTTTNATAVIYNSSSFIGGASFTTPHLVVQSGADTAGNTTRISMAVGSGAQVYFDAINVGGANAGSDLAIYTRISGAGVTEKMRITHNGLVGIGTSSPNQILHVRATSPYIQIERANNASALVGSDSIGMYIGSLSAIPIYFSTNGTERMRIDASGNVGIGTNNPSSFGKLTVSQTSGNTVFQLNTTTNGAGTYVVASNGGGVDNWTYGGYVSYGTTSAASIVFNTNVTERMRINSTGDVGIGTSSPSGGRLVVAQSNSVQPAIYLPTDESTIQGPNANTQIRMGGNITVKGAGVTSIEAVASYITFATAGTERMRITSGGNVGIGTTSAGTLLQIGNPSDANQALRFDFSNSETARINATRVGAGNLQSLLLAGQDTMQFHTNGSERMRIHSSGSFSVLSTETSGSFSNNTPRFHISAATTNSSYIWHTSTSIDSNFYVHRVTNTGNFFFFGYSSSNVGSISTNGSSTSYTTSSDYRLKENIAPMTGALDTISQLKPCTYTWKSTGKESQGFIAHELAEVIPDAVTGEKDAVNEDGSIKSQGIDTSFLVATLTAAIQELKAEFDEYKRTHP